MVSEQSQCPTQHLGSERPSDKDSGEDTFDTQARLPRLGSWNAHREVTSGPTEHSLPGRSGSLVARVHSDDGAGELSLLAGCIATAGRRLSSRPHSPARCKEADARGQAWLGSYRMSPVCPGQLIGNASRFPRERRPVPGVLTWFPGPGTVYRESIF